MKEAFFWALMSETQQASGNDPSVQQGLLERELIELTLDEIIAFDSILRKLTNKAYHWKLWAAAYLINGGCSDDCFMDFRGWLVAQGEAIYTQALNDPDSLSELDYLEEDMDWEGYSYLAFTVYERRTGGEMPINEALIHPATPVGKDWEEDDLASLLPRLSQKYDG
ncbi:MAG: DUF4240 domain-containing protein [Saprospiraceae bacterium]